MFENIPLFSGLSKQDLDAIAELAITKTYPAHTIIISEGDRSDSLYLILYGRVKVYVSNDEGAEVILNILGTGDFFGEMALFDDVPRSASIMTLESTRLSMVTKQAFRDCLKKQQDLGYNLIHALNQRVRDLSQNVKNLALLDVYGRVARALVNLAVKQGEQFVVDANLTHQDIANMVGCSREMVSRVLKDMATKGCIKTEGRRIVLEQGLPVPS